MFADIANEFENITKFGLLQYFIDYRDFMQNDFSSINAYYSGNSEQIDTQKIRNLDNLISRSNDLIRTFQTFSGKLGNVGYWQLQIYCQDLKDTLERIKKLPKYLRTAKTSRGYKPYVQVTADIGGMRTIEDLSYQIGDVSEQELIINNDLQEENYEIDKISQITAYVNNNTNVVVTTILEPPIGKAIYGKDINSKITFTDNDLDIVKYEDNIEQKCIILLELNKGDVPEIPNFGKNSTVGRNYNNYNYSELLGDLRNNFLQNDLFQNISITDIRFQNGDIFAKCEIKTKYVYSTTKDLKI